MSDEAQYRKFADECRRFASLARSEEQRKTLLEMAETWTQLAAEVARRGAKS
jgi:hypothetical protein